ncbi:MAG: SsrA-binding protein SmpB [Phycisphaerae bacterium]|nr:SsrA-binding protein SmpB [Phycisphaerae bacterium]
MSKKKAKTRDDEPVIENRKARFHYEIGETLEVGIILWGTEVKSVRDGKVSIAEGYVRVQPEPPRLFLHSVNIDHYAPAGPLTGKKQHALARTRELLAHRREIVKLSKAVQVKGMTVVPLKLYFKNGYAKLLIGVAQGKTQSDKRESIAKRETAREISRAMSKRLR